MPREFFRSDRVADAIQRSLAQIIQQEVRDPRLGMVNINSVNVVRDLSVAKVYVTVVGANSEKEHQDAVDVLNKASSYLRNLVSRELTMRSTPRLDFHYDKVAIQGQALSALIDRAVAEDLAHHEKQADSGKDNIETAPDKGEL